MFLWRVVWFVAVGMLTVLYTGCTHPKNLGRLNAPPQGDSEDQHEMADYFAYHSDQGAMADMSISDIHFVSHSKELSGIGEVRLERYAELLATSGGTINYETLLRDEQLVHDRIAVAEEFLADVIPSNNRIAVALGLPGGRGMSAAESIPGQAVAKQPEQRGTAYNLRNAGGGTDTGS